MLLLCISKNSVNISTLDSMQQQQQQQQEQNLLSVLEKTGMEKVIELRDSKNKTEEQVVQSLHDIINDGNAEFYAANGRNMTYSEMRSTYG
jgi:hypothetical protein